MVIFMIRSFYIFALFILAPFVLKAESCCGGGGTDSFPIAGCQVRDFDPLREYINSKRSECGQEKLNNLTISGDVRTSWAHITEKYRNCQLRGTNGILVPELNCPGSTVEFRNPLDAFEITCNLYIDYVYDRAWCVSWIGFNNRAGLQGSFPCCSVDPQACRGSGTCEGICLRKAYLGYNLVTDGCFRLDIEIGRRPLWTVFDSYIQFANRFDGILLFGSYNICGEMDAYVKGGPFVIDERVHHFGYVIETGLLNIYDTKFDLKYSIIDWRKHGKNRCLIRDSIGSKYLNSQITLNYWLNTDYLWKKTKLYGAWVHNHAGNEDNYLENSTGARIITPNYPAPNGLFVPKGKNNAWYAGFLIGQICCQGDWSLDLNYQYVQARAIPDCDLSGIGNGGLADCLCVDDLVAGFCPPNPLLLNRGNYKGVHIEALYAFTDNLIMDLMIDFSSAIDTKIIAGKHNFSRFLMQAIYAF